MGEFYSANNSVNVQEQEHSRKRQIETWREKIHSLQGINIFSPLKMLYRETQSFKI